MDLMMKTRALDRRGIFAALLAAFLIAACGEGALAPLANSENDRGEQSDDDDDDWVAPEFTPSATSVLEGPYHKDAIIRCIVEVATLAVTCTSTQDPDPMVTPVFGGKGVHARVVFDNVQHLPDASEFRIRIRFRNLLHHAIGTRDGDVTGFKAFFMEPPTVLRGTGAVSVKNAHGTAEFTAPNQPFFFYNDRVNARANSSRLIWRFNVDPTVTRFRFRVYVSAHLLPMVAFDMEQDGNRDVYRVNVDGTDLVRLTTQTGVDMSPTVQNDRMVWVSYRNRNAELYTKPITGGSDVRLTTTSWNETEPSFSGLGRLAFISDETGMPRVWESDGDGLNRALVPSSGHAGAIVARPRWQNENFLVYVSSGFGFADIFRVHRTNGGATRFMPTTGQRNGDPSFNSDASLMAFVSTRDNATQADVWVYNRITTELTRITNRADADFQPTFLHDNSVAWIQRTGSTYHMRYRSAAGNQGIEYMIPLPAEPRNPAGIPLLR
jgi:hypothetical protein